MLVSALARSHLQFMPSFWSPLQFNMARKTTVLHRVGLLFQGATLFFLICRGFDRAIEFNLPKRNVIACRVFNDFRIGVIFRGCFNGKVFLGRFEFFGVGVYLQPGWLRFIFDHSLMKFLVICKYGV